MMQRDEQTRPSGHADQAIVASDLEGTLSTYQTWRGMRDYLLAHGRARPYRRFFVRHLPALARFRLGLANGPAFKERWIVGVLRLFAGATPEEFAAMAAWVVERALWPQRRQAVVAELQAHRRVGRRVIVISGLFEPLLDAFNARLGDVEGIGTPLRFVDGRFSGELAGPFNTGAHKAQQLRLLVGNGRLVAAYGDTEGDVPMLEMSVAPVAVYPDAMLRRVAQARGWRILED